MMTSQEPEKLSRRELLTEWGWKLAALGSVVALPGASLLYEHFRTSRGPNHRYIKIVGYNPRSASKGYWKPDQVVVTKGTTVTLQLFSADVVHSFLLPGYGINEPVWPGHPHEITFTAHKAGQFVYYCALYCGPGHKRMTGKFIVKE